MPADTGHKDLTEFPAKAHPMMLKHFMAGKEDIRDTDSLPPWNLAGMALHLKSAKLQNTIKNQVNLIKSKSHFPIRKIFAHVARTVSRVISGPHSIREIKRQLHFIKGLINDLRHRGNRIAFQAIGTAALRDAANAEDILEAIADEIGDEIEFEVVESHVEAALSAYGLTMFYPKASGVLVDMGGGSTEFAILKNGQLKKTESLAMGTGSIGASGNPKKFVKATAKTLPKKFKKIDTLFLSGGTFRNINKAICAVHKWDIKAETPPEISLSDYKKFVKSLKNMDDTSWKLMPENLQSRREFMGQALEVVKRLEQEFPDDAKSH